MNNISAAPQALPPHFPQQGRRAPDVHRYYVRVARGMQATLVAQGLVH
jgi:hypothetical protein